MAFNASSTSVALAATADGLVALGAGVSTIGFEGRDVTAVAAAGDTVWALVEHREVHRLTGGPDRGRSELVASLDDDAGLCLVLHRGRPWIGGHDARLWRLDGGELEAVASFDLAPGHEDWYTPWGGRPSIFSLVSIDEPDLPGRVGGGSALAVNVHVGGILRTDDDGGSWRPTIDIDDDVHQVTAAPDGRLLAATGMRGLAESGDGGATWRYHGDGLHSRYALAVAATGDGALLGVSSGPRADDGTLYRFDGHRFVPCRDGLPLESGGVIGPRRIAAAGDEAVVSLPGGTVHASADGGRSWQRMAVALPAVNQVILTDWANPTDWI